MSGRLVDVFVDGIDGWLTIDVLMYDGGGDDWLLVDAHVDGN